MDHERKVVPLCQRDVRGKYVALALARGVIVVEVKAGLADRHHLRVRKQFLDAIDACRRIVWMHAGRRKDIGKRGRESDGLDRAFEACTHRDTRDHAGIARLCQLRRRGRCVEMTMVVDPARRRWRRLGHGDQLGLAPREKGVAADDG